MFYIYKKIELQNDPAESTGWGGKAQSQDWAIPFPLCKKFEF